ncbi:hypothetical protein [Burkholderia cenocepacia]|uniref:hypothetical protein n=1 Tax=Burkholderia cenocepacia TaxID=95486 RepID=UPI00264BC15A|nr:hypothetical protein [Burkholderia cenocepacia]MDN7537061.1 hypothetical protein [Burkholderia cenocepacia]
MLTTNHRIALRQARRLIALKKQQFICHALEDVAAVDGRLDAAVNDLKRYILTKLRPHAALGCWQEAHGYGKRSDEQRRADRLAWIDWMLEGGGDEPAA